MSLKPAQNTKRSAPILARGGLARTIAISLMLITLVPVLLLGVTNTMRTTSLLEDQVTSQMQAIVHGYATQLNEMAVSHEKTLDLILHSPNFKEDVETLVLNYQNYSAILLPRIQLENLFTAQSQSGADRIFDLIALLTPEGEVMVSTTTRHNGTLFTDIPEITGMIGKNATSLLYGIQGIYDDQLVVVSTRTYLRPYGSKPYTLIGVSSVSLPRAVVTGASAFFDNSIAYYLTDNDQLVGYNAEENTMRRLTLSAEQSSGAQDFIVNHMSGGTSQSASITDQQAISYTEWLPKLNAGLAYQVPYQIVSDKVRALMPFNLGVLVIAILIALIATAVGTAYMTRPLLQLTERAREFARGDWSQRIRLNRRDEFGILAGAFNSMVEQLSDLYRSLEMKVEQRTHQLRTASEVAQLAISSTSQSEIVQRTVDLIVERFGYDYAAIYLLDETASNAVLRGSAMREGLNSEYEIKDHQLSISAISLIGWVATNNQARIAQNLTADDRSSQVKRMLPTTCSEIAVPIALGNQVVGVLNVQSASPDSFDSETSPVFQTIANQIATGLRTLMSLESTQYSLASTSLLYRTSRQITQAKNPDEVLDLLTSALKQTNYVSFVLAVEKDQLKLLSMSDTRTMSSDSALIGISLPMQRGVSRLEGGNFLVFDNLQTPSEFFNLLLFFDRRGCRSAALIPILENGQVTKILALGSRDKEPINAAAIQPYLNLTEVVSTTLDRHQVLAALEQHLNELQTLANVSQSISTETSLDRIFEAVHHQVTDAMGGGLSFVVALHNTRNNTIEIPYLYEDDRLLQVEPFPLGEGLTSHILQTGKPLMLVKNADEEADRLGARTSGNSARSWLGVPLTVGGNIIGAMIIQDSEREERFSENDLTLMTTLAPQVAASIRNAQLLSEQQKALQAYDQERFLLNTLLDNIPDLVYFKDPEGRYIRASHSAAQNLGLDDPDALIGKSTTEILDGDLAAVLSDEENSILETRQSVTRIDEKHDVAGKAQAWFLTSKIPMLSSEGEIAGLLGIERDITDLKRTEELAKTRASQLQTAAEIARDASTSLDVGELLNKAINLVRDRFGFYHASVFLVDPLGEYAVLRESTGEAGRMMKERGHRLAVGSQSIVGRATKRGEALVVNNVLEDPAYYANPLLPDTRAELAIPMRAADQVIGALDVQSTLVNAFHPEEISILQILADQLAVAITNANLYGKTQEHIGKHRLLHQITSAASAADTVSQAFENTVQALRQALDVDRVDIFTPSSETMLTIAATAASDDAPADVAQIPFGTGIIGQVALQKASRLVTDTRIEPNYVQLFPATRSEVAVPILYNGELQGVLNIESAQVAAFDENDREIFATLGNSLGSVIANIQLVNAVRRQVERQRKIYEITSRIRRMVDVESILEASAREIAGVVNARRAQIRISVDEENKPPTPTPPNGGNGSNGHKAGGGLS